MARTHKADRIYSAKLEAIEHRKKLLNAAGEVINGILPGMLPEERTNLITEVASNQGVSPDELRMTLLFL